MYISSIETYLPGCNIDNEKLSKLVNFKPQLIEKLFGNYGRHFSTNIETGNITSNAADLVSLLIEKLVKYNGFKDIEFIILSTATPDHLLPTSLNEACYKLGLKNIETYQITGGCSGALQALNLANYIIKSKSHQKGLVIGVECSNKFLNIFNEKVEKLSPKELVNYFLFGDAVGGCIVQSKHTAGAVEIKDIYYEYLGLDEVAAQSIDWHGSRNDADTDSDSMIQEEYKLIEKLVPNLTSELYHKIIEHNNNNKEPRWIMPPQLSGKMVKEICNKMNIPDEKILSLVDIIGNCANAAIYFQLKEFYDLAEKGDTGVAISIESSRWLSSGLYVKKGDNNE